MALKKIPEKNKGLPSLPKKVRNKMGYMKAGGTIQKKKFGGILKAAQAAKTVNKKSKASKNATKDMPNYGTLRKLLDEKARKKAMGQNVDSLNKRIEKQRIAYGKMLNEEGKKKAVKKAKGGVISSGQGKVMQDRIN